MTDIGYWKSFLKDIEMMKSRTVILWGRGDVISWAVEYFLANWNDREVIQISEEQGVDALLQEVEKVNPDVVIIHQGDSARDTRLPVQLLHEHPGLKVITLSLEDNSMEVYHRQKVWIEQVSDLLSAVES